jgi:hypothetical protein
MTVKKLNDGEWICDLRPSGVKGRELEKIRNKGRGFSL